MGRFVVGDIVVIAFPFTDLSSVRRRQALVLSVLEGDDIVICEITSVIRKDSYAVLLENDDLESGKLKVRSIIRPNLILTIDRNKINYTFGKVKDLKLREVFEKLKLVFKMT